MIEGNDNRKMVCFRPFNYKWYEFLITYGILNIFFFLNINNVLNSMYENFLKLHASNFIIDGSDLSILVNLFAVPLLVLLVLADFGIVVLQEFLLILLFKFVYFKSMIKDEEKGRLNRYVKIALLCFMLVSIIGIMFLGSIWRVIFFVSFYLPMPFFTFIFICLKMKRYIAETAETPDKS